MNLKIVFDTIGTVLKIMGLMLLVPGVVAALYHETIGIVAFALTVLLSVCTGIILSRLGTKGDMGNKEAFAAVSLGWLLATFFGALPFVFQGIGLVDALFESVSGFSATGATILTESNAQGYYIVNSTLVNNSISCISPGKSEHRFDGLRYRLSHLEQPYILWPALLAVLPAAYWGSRHNLDGCGHLSPTARGRSPTFPGRDGGPEQGYDHAQSYWDCQDPLEGLSAL